MIPRLRSFIVGLLRRDRVENDLSDEVAFHLEARVQDLTRRGLTPAEARRRARLEFGPVERYKEDVRRARGLRLIDELRSDLLYGWRALRRAPGFTLVAALSLALGIGANTLVFSLLDSTLLRAARPPRAESTRGHLDRALRGTRSTRHLEHPAATLPFAIERAIVRVHRRLQRPRLRRQDTRLRSRRCGGGAHPRPDGVADDVSHPRRRSRSWGGRSPTPKTRSIRSRRWCSSATSRGSAASTATPPSSESR